MTGLRSWQGRENSLRKGVEEGKGDCRRLWAAGGERGFLACSLDMGQEINGTSNTDANSVNQAAQRPTSIMSCSIRIYTTVDQRSMQDLVPRSVNHRICTSLNQAMTRTINQLGADKPLLHLIINRRAKRSNSDEGNKHDEPCEKKTQSRLQSD